jgi:hypothetical protein
VPVERSNGVKLRFAGATFHLDNGVQRTYRKAGPVAVGSKAIVIFTTFAATAGARHLAATVEPLAASMKQGVHSLTMRLYYEGVGHSGLHRRVRTLTTHFSVCSLTRTY